MVPGCKAQEKFVITVVVTNAPKKHLEDFNDNWENLTKE